jgi:hypothetical protein
MKRALDGVLDVTQLLSAHFATVAGGVCILLELLCQHGNANLGFGWQPADILLHPALQEMSRGIHRGSPRATNQQLMPMFPQTGPTGTTVHD